MAGRRAGHHNGCPSINLSPLPCEWWAGGRGRACGGARSPTHAPIWGSARPPSLPERIKPKPSPPPAPKQGRRGSHLPFSALKRLQGPALLTRGDPSPVPASPVCPSPPSLLPSHSPGYGVAAPGGDAGGAPGSRHRCSLMHGPTTARGAGDLQDTALGSPAATPQPPPAGGVPRAGVCGYARVGDEERSHQGPFP